MCRLRRYTKEPGEHLMPRPVRAAIGPEWSAEVMAVIKRAESLGLTLAPHGKPPFGWDLLQGTQVIRCGLRLPEVEAELASRGSSDEAV